MSVIARAVVTPYSDGTASVGSGTPLTFYGWTGWIPDLQNLGDTAQRLGGIGSIGQIVGKRGRSVAVSAWVGFTDPANVLTYCTLWEALNYRVVAIADPWGRKLPRVRLTNCEAAPGKGRGPSTSGTAQLLYLVRCTADAERLPDQ